MQVPPRMEPRQRFASLPCQFSPTDRHRKGACQRFSVAAPSSAAGYSIGRLHFGLVLLATSDLLLAVSLPPVPGT
ncbi:unnamed protein product [Fusarium graminearum]|uniref:Chromosome 4, complete genome n=2 Tax=Gibberella zeae TaxID=5518 RepID=A0A098DSR1_GIBZE|nr:unnamed protein product [Fusarium graminearum]CAF3508091.1 unnamed protein product [Fusarium graminearum]CAG1988745.1 unnamed protein product [Fusarium graminearum]CAG1996710.1 unnamed protein product [Fusarium graminearum]CEF84407.1 unnamed protein product [Fusarium graminearum]